MRDSIDPSQLIMLYTTTQFNRDRAEEHPPQLPFEVDDPERRAQLKQNALVGASYYDMYRDIIQVSLMLPSGFIMHFMVCDDPATPDSVQQQGTRDVCIVSDEGKLLTRVGDVLSTLFQEGPTGVPMQTCIFGGWKLPTDIWPMLINKCIAHDVYVPRALRTALDRRFSDVNYLLDVSSIYAQGAHMAMRRLPAMVDALSYWGFTVPSLPEDMGAAMCDSPIEVANRVDAYLIALRQAVLKYYALPYQNPDGTMIQAQNPNAGET